MRRAVVAAFVSGSVAGSLALSAPPAGAVVPAPNPPNSTYYVSSNTAASGGSCGDPDYNTIAAALAVVVGGDTIVVCSGTYQEGALTVPSGVTELTIKGEVYPSLANPSVFPAVGPQAGAPVLDGRDATTPALRTRILDAPSTFVHLENLTFQYGKSPSEQSTTAGGGGVRAKRLSLDHLAFDHNEASDGTDPGAGGAVRAVDASPANTAAAPTVEIDSSSFTNNAAAYGGGAVYSLGYVAVNNSAFDSNAAGNTTEMSAYGGAIAGDLFVTQTPIVVTSSSFTNNSLTTDPSNTTNGSMNGTALFGGAITVTNSTISGNTAFGNFYFGVITGASATVRFSTVVNNTYVLSQTCGACGGSAFAGGALSFGGSIVAGNTGTSCFFLGATAFTDEGSNLTDLSAPCAPTGTSQAVANLAALKLGTLGAQGTSGTQSYPLLADSPALDFADCDLGSVLATALAVDQNGTVRPQGASCDAGSYEVGGAPLAPPSGLYILNKGAQTCGTYSTIAAAIAAAVTDDTIIVCSGTYQEHGLAIPNTITELTIIGEASATVGPITYPAVGPQTGAPVIDAQTLDRIFDAPDTYVHLENLTLTNGKPSSGGGGAVRAKRLTLDHMDITLSTTAATSDGGAVLAVDASPANTEAAPTVDIDTTAFTGNSATRYGGAVHSTGFVLVNDSTFEDNDAKSGGALYTEGGGSITGSAFTGNAATADLVTGNGGAVFTADVMSISKSTFDTNSARASGGAIWTTATEQWAMNVVNSTFTGNGALTNGGASVIGQPDNIPLTFTNKTDSDGLGLPFVNNVHALGNRVYAAAGGVGVSTDGGTNWTTKTTDNGLGSNNVADIYALGNTVYAATGYGLGISTDGGVNWTNTNYPTLVGYDVLSVFALGSTIYAGTQWGLSISKDGGYTWTYKTKDADGLVADYILAVYAVGDKIYLGTNRGVSISTDGGDTWTNMPDSVSGMGYYVQDIYAVGNTVYAATSTGLSISTDGGVTWTLKTSANGLAADGVWGVYAAGNSIYAATLGGGVSISTDGGSTWTTKTTSAGLGSDTTYGVWAAGGRLVVATNSGVSISTNPVVSLVHVTAVDNTPATNVALSLLGGQLENTLFVDSGACTGTIVTAGDGALTDGALAPTHGTLSDDPTCGEVTTGLADGLDTYDLHADNAITKTYSLKLDSPAVDGGFCAPILAGTIIEPADDQNGTVRPQGASCDAGSYEVGGAPPPPQPGVWIERSAGNGGPVLPEDCTAYPTISAAVADAFDNDVIHICPGLYVEDNTLNLLGLANITFVGDGDVPDDVQVDGGFPATGPNKHRIVNAAGQTVSFENLVLQNGYLEGAATHEGGAAVIASHVNATNVIFRNNRVVQSATGDNYGGAVSAGTATITDSAFSAHGTEVNGQGGSATLGGALYLSGAGASTITRTSFFHNVTHTDEVINSVTENTKGGAVFATGPLTVTDSYFIENGATFGGAIAALGTLTITNTVFDGNHNFASAAASQGGAVWAQGSATITDSEFLAKSEFSRDSANDPDEGVAVRAFGSLTISGSTFTDDFTTALKATGVVYSSATGGSPDVSITNSTFFRNDLQASTVVHAAGKVELVYVTAVNNTASGANVVDATDSLTITNSLFALNTGAASAVAGCNGGAGSAKTSTVSDSSCGDVVGSFSPSSFGAFTYHGAALTKTLELAAGNAGIAAANCAAAPTVTLDQNGTTRGATCDSGAMEYAVPDSDRSCPDDTVTTTVGVDTATGRPVCQLVLTADGDFDVPEGVSSVDVVLVGGGGGGGGGGTDSAGTATMSGGGGGGGSVSLHKGVTVTPLATIPVTVGSGGAYGAGGSPAEVWRGANGGDGGTTSFLSLAALGGKGGTGGGEEGGTYYVGAGGSTPAASSGESKNAAHSGASGATLRTWDINHYYTASGAGAGAGGAGSVGVLGPRFGLYSSTFGGAGGVGFTPADSTSLFGSDRWPWSLGDTNYNRFAAYVGLAMGGSGAITGVGNYDTYTFYCGRGASLHGWDWGWTGVGSSSGIIVLDGVITGTDADMEQPAGDGPCGASTGFAYGSGGGGGAGFQSWQADGSSGRAGAVIIRYVVPGVPGETGNGRVWIERDLGSGGVPVDEAGAQDDTVSCDHPTYASITAAVGAAEADDVIHVCSGVYREAEIVPTVDNLTIQGTEWVDPSPPARPVGPGSGVGETLLNDVVIDGELTEGDASTRHRIFDASGLSITFNNVVLQNGAAADFGGAVKALQASFVDTTVQDNTAPGGGAVFVTSLPCGGPIALLLSGRRGCGPIAGPRLSVGPSVTVLRSEFLRNGAQPNVGAPLPANGVAVAGAINGGAVYANGGLVTVTDSLFEDNEAAQVNNPALPTDGAGGAVLADSVEVYGSTFRGNSALYHGGAISASSVTVRASMTSGVAAGTLFDSNSVAGDATRDGYGGAVWSDGVDVASASFVTNTADNGGAIASAVPVNNAPVSAGDPVLPATVIIEASTFESNSATDDGGAVLNKAVSGSTSVYNSTFSANDAGNAGGAVYAQSTLSVSFSTFDANTADVSGGVFWTPVAPSVDDNIFSFAAVDEAEAAKNGCNDWASWVNQVPAKDTKNFTTNYWCPGTVVTVDDLGLSPLADNGGPTETIAIDAGSAALDAADETECASRQDPTDQRGNHRAVGKACDAGAYEYFGTVTLDGPAGQDNTFTSPDGVKTLHILLVGGGGGGGAFGPNGEAGGGGGGGEVVECTIDLTSSATEVHYYFGLGGAEGENGEDSKVWISDEASPECVARGGNAGVAGGVGSPAGIGGAEGVSASGSPFGGGLAAYCTDVSCTGGLANASLAGGGGGGAGGKGSDGTFDFASGLGVGGAGGVGVAPSSTAFGDTYRLFGGGGGGGATCLIGGATGGAGGIGGGGEGASPSCVDAPVSANPPSTGDGSTGGGGGGGAGTIGGGAGGNGTGEVRTPAPLGPDDVIHVCVNKRYVIYGARYYEPKVYYCIPEPVCTGPASPSQNGSVSSLDPECCPTSPATPSDPECCPSGPVEPSDPNHCDRAPEASEYPFDGYSTVVGDTLVESGIVASLPSASEDEVALPTPQPLHYEHGIPDGYIKVNPEDYPDITPPTCTTEYEQGDGVALSGMPITCTGGDPGDKMFDYSFLDGGLRIHPAVLTVKPKHLRVPFDSEEPNPYEYTIRGFKLGETVDVLTELPECDSEYTKGANAGAKFDIACDGAEAENYVFRYVKSHIHVEKVKVSLRAADRTVTYGDAAPSYGFTLSGLKGPDTLLSPDRLAGFVGPVCSSTYTPLTSAGSADINCVGAVSTNYEFVPVPGTLTVRKASLRVVPKSISVAYGAASPQAGFTLVGFVNGESTPGSGYTAPRCVAAGYTASTAAGSSLPVSCSGGVSRNYELDQSATSTLTVTRALATITAASRSISYGTVAPVFGFSLSGLRNGQTATTVDGFVPAVCSSAYTAATPSGATPAVTCSGASSTNYTFTYVAGRATVTKAVLTVTPDAKIITRGAAIPTYTSVITGWMNGQGTATAAGYTKPVCRSSYTTKSAVGTYTITCSGGSAANYTFAFKTATLTVR